mmetsp:Transcript_99015/g.154806  ORF Transcript_99015/g.154806 Transcript_99015/m.154806 type:complete len:879 (+) Transcript_99015:94-2730(+)
MKISAFGNDASNVLVFHFVALNILENVFAASALVSKRESSSEWSMLHNEDSSSMKTPFGIQDLTQLPHAAIARAAAHMSLESALHIVKPPLQVLELLQKVNATSSQTSFPGFAGGPDISSSEIAEAITSLNALAANAQQRLDVKSLACKGYDDYYKELFESLEQEMHGIARQQNGADARLSSARTSLAALDTQRQVTRERQREQQKIFDRSIASKKETLQKMRDSLHISEFLLDATKCDALFLSVSTDSHSFPDAQQSGPSAHKHSQRSNFKMCRILGSESNVEFEDARLRNLTSRLTSDGKSQLFSALASSRLSLQALLADPSGKNRIPDAPEDGDEVNLLRKPISTHQPPYDEQKANKCTFDIELSCGEVNDAFATLWGDMKDSVDALDAEIDAVGHHRRDFEASTQHELEAIGGNEAMLKADIVDVSTQRAQLAGQLADKAREMEDFKQFASKAQLGCTSAIHEIVFAEMCGIFKLRSQLAAPASPEDCEVSEWRKSGRCSKRCDSGLQTWKRQITKKGSPSGVGCPALQIESPCNQFGCPVDCKLSTWAEWSNCTQACGGGIRYRTRDRVVNPKYGGFECDVMQETQQCNTHACDKNCKLGEWSAFSECSQACDAGFLQRRRLVLQPAVGSGTCPEKDSSERLDRKACNKQACVGDEECTSKYDVVLAIDGSGSVTEKGFSIMKTFAEKLAKRLRGGSDAVRLGLVQFGNGVLDVDNIISDAVAVSPLTQNVADVVAAVSSLKWQKGFTNLAQAAMKSRDLIRLASPRSGSDAMVVFLTDGRPSFKTMAIRAMQELRASARVMVVHVKAYPERHNVEFLKSFATEPVEVNYLHIPGKKVLKLGYDEFAAKVIVQACKNVESPSAIAEATKSSGP